MKYWNRERRSVQQVSWTNLRVFPFWAAPISSVPSGNWHISASFRLTPLWNRWSVKLIECAIHRLLKLLINYWSLRIVREIWETLHCSNFPENRINYMVTTQLTHIVRTLCYSNHFNGKDYTEIKVTSCLITKMIRLSLLDYFLLLIDRPMITANANATEFDTIFPILIMTAALPHIYPSIRWTES